MAADQSARILLGRIAGAHGIRGEVLIRSFTQAPESIGAYGALSDAPGTRELEIKVVRVTPRGVIARVTGISDRNGAEALKGVDLYVDRTRLPAADESAGEFYHADLIGLAAVDLGGTAIGTVVAVQNFGAGDLLEVRLAGKARTELIPFRDAFVPEVDLAAGRLVVHLPSSQEGDDKDDNEGPAVP